MTPVFLDTVGLLALWDKSDQWHSAATTAFDQIVSMRRSVLTSSYVLLECANAAARRPYRFDVIDLRDELMSSGLVYEPTAVEIEAAWGEYGRGSATAPGIVDLVSFQIMHRLQIQDAFTNDRHFKAFGFQALF